MYLFQCMNVTLLSQWLKRWCFKTNLISSATMNIIRCLFSSVALGKLLGSTQNQTTVALYHTPSNTLMPPVDHKWLHFVTILPGCCYHPHLAPSVRVNRAIRLLPSVPSHRIVSFTLLRCRWVPGTYIAHSEISWCIHRPAGRPS